jgi:hypothetical protein
MDRESINMNESHLLSYSSANLALKDQWPDDLSQIQLMDLLDLNSN